MSDGYITQRTVYQQFRVCFETFKKAMPFIDGFPAPVFASSGRQIGKPRYRKQQFEAWAEGKDLREVMKAALALANQRSDAPTASAAQSIDLHRRFTAGEFATPEQRQQIALKRLVARTTKPKTTRVSIIPDWMRE